MKFYTKQHNYYCGIDLHARTMYWTLFGVRYLVAIWGRTKLTC